MDRFSRRHSQYQEKIFFLRVRPESASGGLVARRSAVRKILHRLRSRVLFGPNRASVACMVRHTAITIFSAALVLMQWTCVFAQDKPPGNARPSRAERPAAKPAAGVLGSCRAVTVCHDARPLGDFGPPRQTCQKNTICDSSRGSSIR